MNYLIDIHNHCLPAMDDGSKSMQETLEMLQIAYEQGIREIIVTPHFKRVKSMQEQKSMEEVFGSVQAMIRSEKINITLHMGYEVFYSSNLLEWLMRGNSLTLAKSKYILIEFYPDEEAKRIRQSVYELIAAGYSPILAHVERYQALKGMETVKELIELGAYLQVNVGTVLGENGREMKRYVQKLLKCQLVHFIATDAHDGVKRKPKMMQCMQYIERKYGREYAKELSYTNPKKILNQWVE